jgi:hypothetical protein
MPRPQSIIFSLKNCPSTLPISLTGLPAFENLKAFSTISSITLVKCLEAIFTIASSKSSSRSCALFAYSAQLFATIPMISLAERKSGTTFHV